ncbi:MAG: proline--tRNA ligase [Actinobacteria bacterium]|nr:MAG: proline--tRNA ligase [Actinomycetota bacterium]
MTRLSQAFIPTEREAPADAEALSHKLLVRAGMVRQTGAGLWSWLPAGWRVHQNVVQIVREEMDGIGCQEMLAPVITPGDLWKRSGRWPIPELFRFQDRKRADLLLALSHEETMTFHVANAIRSYRDLPKQLYHFQTKGRDEARPRAGVLRTREFIMKDAYSFDRDLDGLDESYQLYRAAYGRVFDRVGLDWYECESDVGMMGGIGAHEYMAPTPSGENDVALAPGYSANLEIASAEPQPAQLASQLSGELETPGLTTIADVARHLGVHESALLKAFPVVTESRGLLMVFLRGDHRLGDIKLQNALGEPFRPARDEELPGPAGFLGPTPDVPHVLDSAVGGGPWIVGANRLDLHLGGVTIDGEHLDVRTVEAGDTVNGSPVRIEPAIEIGNIFKLGTRYSEPLGASYLDENGSERLIVMGSYGIGPARLTAAAVEQHGDERGIAWPKSIAPWDVELVALGKEGTPEREAADALYEELEASDLQVLYDDRDAGGGSKFADAELIGCPLRLTVGRRSLESGRAEAQARRGQRDFEAGVPLTGAVEDVRALWDELP